MYLLFLKTIAFESVDDNDFNTARIRSLREGNVLRHACLSGHKGSLLDLFKLVNLATTSPTTKQPVGKWVVGLWPKGLLVWK